MSRAAGSRQHLPAPEGALSRHAPTFSTSVGLASAEEITPETTPQMTLISNVSSATKKRKSDPKELKGRCMDCIEQARNWEQQRSSAHKSHGEGARAEAGQCHHLTADLSPRLAELERAAGTLSNTLREKRVLLVDPAHQTRNSLRDMDILDNYLRFQCSAMAS